MDNKGFKLAHLTKDSVKSLLPQRALNSNKGTFGNVLNIAGSRQFPGASYLSSISALKVGAGIVMLATNSSTIPIVASLSPDITYLDLGETHAGSVPKDSLKHIQLVANPDVYSIGCGLGINSSTVEFALSFLITYINSQTPIIIDADCINILSKSKNIVLPLNSIITPHPLELSRLINVDVDIIQQDRVKWAWEASKRFDCIVLLKGYKTVIAVPNGEIYINTTGNSALAKAGTGDVLTGMIAGFCAQGLNLENAACVAAYLHGLTGEIACRAHTQYGVLASNLTSYIPNAIKETLNT